jgi:hypothetical protein
MNGGTTVQGNRQPLRVIEGGRAQLERELLWLVALGGNERRRDELMRQLTASANHELVLVARSERGAIDA